MLKMQVASCAHTVVLPLLRVNLLNEVTVFGVRLPGKILPAQQWAIIRQIISRPEQEAPQQGCQQGEVNPPGLSAV